MEKSMFYDKDFRRKVRQLDEESLMQIMAGYLKDTQVKVLVNTKNTFYFVIPTEGGNSDIELQSAQVAGAQETFGSLGCLASFGCASSTISTGGSASTVVCVRT